MSLDQVLNHDLISRLAVFISSREWKNAKELAKGISRFQLNDDDDSFETVGWPIGRIQSDDDFNTCCESAKKKSKYIDISTRKLKKGGLARFVYGDGWCVERGTPDHIALEKIIDINEPSYDVDITDSGWPYLVHDKIKKEYTYVWDCDKNVVCGVIIVNELQELSSDDTEFLHKYNIPCEKYNMKAIKNVKM